MFDRIKIEVTPDGNGYEGEPEKEFNVRRIPHIERAKLYDKMNMSRKGDATTALEGGASYQIAVITRSIVGDDGKQLFSGGLPAEESTWADESQVAKHPQLWHPHKIAIYATRLDDYQNPRVKDVAKNSAATQTGNG